MPIERFRSFPGASGGEERSMRERLTQGRAERNMPNWGRALTTATTGGLAVFVALMLVIPSATAVSPNVIMKAPYKKAIVTLTNTTVKNGCGNSTLVTPPSFNKTTGVGGFSGSATTTWCTSSVNNTGIAQGMIQVNVPISVKVNGTHTINAIWSTIIWGSANLTAGTCKGSSSVLYSGCTRDARAYVYGKATLLDKTTKKSVGPSNKWAGNFVYLSNYTSCYFTTCSSTTQGKSTANISGSFPWLWAWNSTQMNTTHKYVLQMFIFGGARAELKTSMATLTGASANAQLNSATLGNLEQLLQITIS